MREDVGGQRKRRFAVAVQPRNLEIAAVHQRLARKIGFAGGIGGSDSEYGDGTVSYGHGGDNRYGRGARGADTADSVMPASGYGAGGWGSFAPTHGAVLIYGYVRQTVTAEVNENEQ